ncbi:MAG: zinc ribbon domain-containing protein [Candidatus Heimdallarchaeota archaeon]|nr:zinc ribbon domain-containing protein [Candidatus Heimdallarchaeota archaeon]
MKKKILFIGFIVLLAYTSPAFAQTETEILFTDADTLEGGYYVRYRMDISYNDVSVNVNINSSEPVDFGVCNEGGLEEGSDLVWYYHVENVTLKSMTFILDKGTFDFGLLNWGVDTASYSITVEITFDPTNTGSSGSWIWYIIIGAIVVGGIVGIFLFSRSRRAKTSQSYAQPQTYIPSQVHTYQPTFTTQQPAVITPMGVKVCPNCGGDNEDDARFCTTCGSKI